VIYGVESTTDMRCPETVVKRFRSEPAARNWAEKGGGYAWPGAADNSLPGPSRNFHHRLRELYRMPAGWRPPSQRELRQRAHEDSTPSYPRNAADALAKAIWKKGERL
jgi:hypothetical protein